MFMIPEPPPIDYHIVDVSPSYKSDGIFYHGNPAPCHIYVAKYLKPIKRTLKDPPPPVQPIVSRHLDALLAKEAGGFVDPCNGDNGLVYETNRSMMKWKRDELTAKKPLFASFPRSSQYELWYIKNRRLKDGQKYLEEYNVTTVECPKDDQKLDNESEENPCHLQQPPFWWKDHASKPKKLPVGNPNDYAYHKLSESEPDNRKISERLELDHPKKYMPGVIHRLKDPEDSSMKDSLHKADTFQVVAYSDKTKTLPEKIAPKDTSFKLCRPLRKRPCMDSLKDSKQSAEARDKTASYGGTRWQPLFEELEYSGTDLEREEELRKLTKPFLHDLHTWYTKNKPTKLITYTKN